MGKETLIGRANLMKNVFRRDIVFISLISMILLLTLMYAGRSFAPVYPEEGTGEYRLQVFATSDIHGSIIYKLVQPYQYGMAYVSDKVRDARMTDDGPDDSRTVLLDAGDIFQGNAVSNVVKGESVSAVYDAMGYDAVAVGNHEFDWGIDTVIDADQTMRDYTLDGRKHKNEIPVVCCNIYQNGKKADFARDYVILEKTAADEAGEELDVRIAVIGFAEEYSDSVADKHFEDLGYSIKTDYDEVNRIASDLEERDECDATILLAHGNSKTIANALGSSSDVDLVIGGHIHDDIEGETAWGLRYLSPKGQGASYLHAEIVFENDGKGGARIKDSGVEEAEVVSVMDIRDRQCDTEENAEYLDRDVIDVSNKCIDKVNEYLNEEIGYVTVSVNRNAIKGSDKRTSLVSNFITGAMLEAADADVAIVNISGMRGGFDLKPGQDRYTVRLADIYNMLPFDDIIYIYDLTYGELMDVFRFSMSTKGWALMTCMSGVDCYFVTDPTDDGSSGEKYRRKMVDALVKDGEVIYKDGEWKEGWADKRVRLVTIEYVGVTSRNKDGVDNPLLAYNGTDKLVESHRVLRDALLEVYRKEAKENDGLLPVDTATHFINKSYDESHN